jgi:hypothetical protein
VPYLGALDNLVTMFAESIITLWLIICRDLSDNNLTSFDATALSGLSSLQSLFVSYSPFITFVLIPDNFQRSVLQQADNYAGAWSHSVTDVLHHCEQPSQVSLVKPLSTAAHGRVHVSFCALTVEF